MKKMITMLIIVGLSQMIAFSQQKYEMVIEKTDGTRLFINIEDHVRTYFRERNNDDGTYYLSCPDTNHPHMIDLGLSSGTKWACCNVGASKPEDYGEYYAWGETHTKSIYNWDTYLYGNWDNVVNIGSDIAGTCYDVATVNWGVLWCMPSKEQFLELINSTDWNWKTQNGVYGISFTGTNGGTLFFPLAGSRWNDELIGTGVTERSGGFYWSSSIYESSCAYNFYFQIPGSVDIGIGNVARVGGLCVRPVHSY